MKYLIAVLLIVSGLNSSAQERLITGRVLDKDTQQPVKNVNIIVQGTTSASTTNARGYFQLAVKPNFKSLLISHVSYQPGIMQIPASDKFKVELSKISQVLPLAVLSFRPPELAAYHATAAAGNARAVRGIEQQASYPGGLEYLNYYLTTNFKFPEKDKPLSKGKTHVTFEVDPSGTVINVNVLDNSINTATRQQIIDLFTSIPAWHPAFQRGEPVSQGFIMPIIYGPVKKSEATTTYLSYYLARNLNYPAEATRLAVEGTVFVYFALNSQQRFTSLEILQGIGAGCDLMVYNTIKAIPQVELNNLMANTGDSVFVLPVDFHLDRTSAREDNLKKPTEAVFLDPVEVLASQPEDYYKQPNYTMIMMPTREFYSVEGAIKHIDNATSLRIVNQQLALLSPDVGKLKNLALLDLENNKLQKLPPELASLSKLEEFYAAKNKLSALPIGMSNLAHLKIVGLAFNEFTEFPPALFNLKRLQALDLGNNNIDHIPAAIGRLKKLKILIFRNNNLQDLPDEFYNLKLSEIYLDGNDLSEETKQKITRSFKHAKIKL